ncbi:tripartite tricarboxylate transporter substrate binding protein [Variovorax sp. dw_308]|uniref:Bug family tripartite tricarboxylate transporter substrate binding protein n=1 Tax=Variovorax sp. dw_308 TaxID=2721546 RepID=UPI001C46748A|nr:tripartite tricarboxylate transporter substrate binding protein [Variovorax sp. dw_308]
MALFENRARTALVALVTAVAAWQPLQAAADGWPDRTIRLVVAYPPDGSTDITARLFAEVVSRKLGQPIIVDNRSGASGTIGALAVSRAPADGYTLLFAASPEVSIAPTTFKALHYSPTKDLAPISSIGLVPFLLVSNPAVPVTDVKSLIGYAKANPGKLNYSSLGNNTSNHLTGELFSLAAGIQTSHVPYRGSGPSMSDLMGGQIQYSFDTPTAAMPNVRAGKLRALAVTSQQRLSSAPVIPTVSESGLPGFSASTWFGLFAPSGTPEAVLDRLNAETVAVLKSPDLSETMKSRGILPTGDSRAVFRSFLAAEIEKWKKLAISVSIVPE